MTIRRARVNHNLRAEQMANRMAVSIEQLLPDGSHLREFPTALRKSLESSPCEKLRSVKIKPIEAIRHVAGCDVCNPGRKILDSIAHRAGSGESEFTRTLLQHIKAATVDAGFIVSSQVGAIVYVAEFGHYVVLYSGLDSAVRITVETMLFGIPAADLLLLCECSKAFSIGETSNEAMLLRPTRILGINEERRKLIERMSVNDVQLEIATRLELLSRFYRDLGVVRADQTTLPIPFVGAPTFASAIGTVLEPSTILVDAMLHFVVAHEFSHVVNGDLGDTESVEKEYRADRDAMHFLLDCSDMSEGSFGFVWCVSSFFLEILTRLVPESSLWTEKRKKMLRDTMLSIAHSNGWSSDCLELGDRLSGFYKSYVSFYEKTVDMPTLNAFDLVLNTEAEDDFYTEMVICMALPSEKAIRVFVDRWNKLLRIGESRLGDDEIHFRRLEKCLKVILQDRFLSNRFEALMREIK